jgi:iron complex transport system ATP-binding protein
MIEARDIGHCYRPGHWLFRHVSLAFRRGRIAALLGVNGSGKTTFLRALCGLVRPQEGAFSVAGTIGYVPQAQPAGSAYRALDMVLLGRSRHLGRFASPRHADTRRALDCLDAVGLAAIAEDRYDRLSGGQKQLVLLARALASDCTALVLDEPVSALDLANQGVVLRLLQQLAQERDLAILFTTHHPEHALAIADDALLFLDAAQHMAGPVAQVMTEEVLSRLYGVPMRRISVTADGRRAEGVLPLHRLHERG